MRDYAAEEELRRRRRRRQRMLRERRRRRRRRRLMLLGGALLTAVAVIVICLAAGNLKKEKAEEENKIELEAVESNPKEESGDLYNAAAPGTAEDGTDTEEEDTPSDDEESKTSKTDEDIPFAAGYTMSGKDSAAYIGSEDMQSAYALLIDLDDLTVVAQKNAYDRISPASMTKILTLLVAAEHIENLDDTFTITREITDYSYSNDCSAAGFDDGETVTVKDLMYGTILPSGADAAAGLAFYVSGSLEGFVELMNDKLAKLGLSDTSHFTNCVGLYDEDHYCTPYDMAIMLKAAMENSLCREVMSAHIYTTSSTEHHPDGIEMSNWFLRRIEDKETNGEVVCAKTGYVVQSGNCAASYSVSNSGKHYICVTANAHSGWRCIYDHVDIYQKYTQ